MEFRTFHFSFGFKTRIIKRKLYSSQLFNTLFQYAYKLIAYYRIQAIYLFRLD